jgi:hypothetical protein
MRDSFIIGISGVAGSGKDTTGLFLEQNMSIFGLKCKRFSLAESLKEQAKSYCIQKFNIDPTNCTREQKEVIRDYLVKLGKSKRNKTGGQFWLNILKEKIKKSDCDIAIITDIRFAEFENDEMNFILDNDGLLIHVARKDIDGQNIPPANSEEAKNDPIIYQASNYRLSLSTLLHSNDIDNLLNNIAEMNKMLYFCLNKAL